MIQEQIIEIFADFLSIDADKLNAETNVFNKYYFNDIDIDDIIDELNDAFDIDIDKDEFLELESIEEMAEYIEYII